MGTVARPVTSQGVPAQAAQQGGAVLGAGPASACRSCGATGLAPILSLGEQPLANALQISPEASTGLGRYPLDLVFCEACSLAQITVSVPPEELFADYRYFSSYSPTVVASAHQLVRRLVAERDLGPGALAMEVASNDGYLLGHYRAAGVDVLGIDPADNVAAVAEARGVPTLRAFFGAAVARELRDAGRRADVLHAHNVMAHVPDPNGVAAGMAEVLAGDGLVVIETPYVRDLVDRLEFDTIYHEHLFYYSLTSLRALLERNGLEVVGVERIPLHGGSLRVLAAVAGVRRPAPAVTHLLEEEERIGLPGRGYFEGFGERVEALCERLGDLLGRCVQAGEALAGYGAAAKATVLVHSVGIDAGTIPYVVDRSPHKQGRFLPGTAIAVVPPERLLADQPDRVLLFVWNFAEEVLGQQRAYRQRGGRFIIPIPEPVTR